MIALRDFVFRHDIFVEAREFDDGLIFTRQPKGRAKRFGPRRNFEVFLRRDKRRAQFYTLTCGPDDHERSQVTIEFPEKALLRPAEAAIEYEACGRDVKRYAQRFPNDTEAGHALFGYVRSESRLLRNSSATALSRTSRTCPTAPSPRESLSAGIAPSRMSISATLWQLQFPRQGDAHLGCKWVDVFAQGVPAHIGTPTPGYGYQSGDPFESFLPPALRIGAGVAKTICEPSCSSTPRRGKARPIGSGIRVAASGPHWYRVRRDAVSGLHDRLCTALRGTRPRLVLEVFRCDSIATLVFEDGSSASVDG